MLQVEKLTQLRLVSVHCIWHLGILNTMLVYQLIVLYTEPQRLWKGSNLSVRYVEQLDKISDALFKLFQAFRRLLPPSTFERLLS